MKTVSAWHWLHRWTPWEQVEAEWSSPLFRIPPRRVQAQRRTCVVCGKQELE